MTRKRFQLAAMMFLLTALIATSAMAWGPRTQRSISVMAMKVISEDYAGIFQSDYLNYERNVLLGSSDSYHVLGNELTMKNDLQVIQAIGTEIQLLRTARSINPNSPYFSYRMGVLSTLVADAIQPYGFVWDKSLVKLQKAINRDIDNHLQSYNFIPQEKKLTFIRDLYGYIQARRAFYDSDKEIIFQDYRDGSGYNGFLKKGGPVYFSRAVQAVADVWNTVLRAKSDASIEPASQRALKWYFLKEIKYLLENDLVVSANESYRFFDAISIEIPAAYEELGQFYYDYGTPEGVDRAIREWSKAYNMGGPERAQVAEKLVAHFLKKGNGFLENYNSQDRKDTDLPNALDAFETALEFENTNDEAADLIKETRNLIKERERRFQSVVSIIAQAVKVKEEAEKAFKNENYGLAIQTYRQSIGLFEAVDDEFREQEKTAKEEIRRITSKIDDVINEVLDQASDAIYAEGEKAEKEHEYEAAIAAYERVPGILASIPEDVTPDFITQKQELIDLSIEKIDKAKRAKIRYETALKQQREAAAARGGAGGGGGGGQQ